MFLKVLFLIYNLIKLFAKPFFYLVFFSVRYLERNKYLIIQFSVYGKYCYFY